MRSRDLAPLGGVLVALLMASAASADTTDGWYAAWDVGAHWDASSSKAHSTGVKPNGLLARWKFRSNTDWAGFARVGYKFNPNFRTELELGYRNGVISSISGAGAAGSAAEPVGISGAKGHQNNWSGMVNLIYDFMPESHIHPFVGVGGGLDHLQIHTGGTFAVPASSQALLASPEYFHARGGRTQFAWQVLGGASAELSPQWAVDVTYRYLRADQEFASQSIATGTGAPLDFGHFKRTLGDHSVTIGLRYAFAAPPSTCQAN